MQTGMLGSVASAVGLGAAVIAVSGSIGAAVNVHHDHQDQTTEHTASAAKWGTILGSAGLAGTGALLLFATRATTPDAYVAAAGLSAVALGAASVVALGAGIGSAIAHHAGA